MHNIKLVSSEDIFSLLNELFTGSNSARITVTGGSMYPFLRSEIDSVELIAASLSNIRKSDIVLIRKENGEYVLHRIVKIKKESIYIAGDAQNKIEGPFPRGAVIAVVLSVWRGERHIGCASGAWRFLSLLWLWLLPFRGFIIKSYRWFSTVKGKFRKANK